MKEFGFYSVQDTLSISVMRNIIAHHTMVERNLWTPEVHKLRTILVVTMFFAHLVHSRIQSYSWSFLPNLESVMMGGNMIGLSRRQQDMRARWKNVIECELYYYIPVGDGHVQ
jgi:hypothetical protein